MVTIYDIAKYTGLSPATVSKVFNNYAGVSQKSRDIVLVAAKELGYTPNTYARTLVTKKSHLISLLSSEDVGGGIAHAHYSGILQSFVLCVQSQGYDVLFINRRLGGDVLSYLDHCHYRGVDGVLIAANTQFTKHIQCVLESDYKCVSVEGIYPDTRAVISDNYMGSMQALEYLYFLGHRKISHITGPLKTTAGRERYDAYLEFHAQKNIPVNPKYVVETPIFNRNSGLTAMTELMQRCWDDLPTAIFAASDEFACAAQTVLQERGFRIPNDMSIIGFDNLPISEYAKITTIHQDRAAIGEAAANSLVQLINDKNLDTPLVTRIPTVLVVRESCARIADH